jgi:hypothetical protein
MWLWESRSNQRSGRVIYNTISAQAKALIDAATAAQFWKQVGVNPPDPTEEVRHDWTLVFKKVGGLNDKFSDLHWMRDDIIQGKHIKRLRAVDDNELAAEGLGIIKGDEKTPLPKRVHIFTNAAGGEHRRFVLKPGSKRANPTYSMEGGMAQCTRASGFMIRTTSPIKSSTLTAKNEPRW